MAIPMGIKIPTSFEYAFPNGAMLLGIEPATDFDRRSGGGGDDQARDRDTGERLWTVTVIDNDPEASRFGRVPVVKVKIAAAHQPVPPASQVPGTRPMVAFEGLTLTPYVDSKKCKGESQPHSCGARQAYSIRATAMVDPSQLRPVAA